MTVSQTFPAGNIKGIHYQYELSLLILILITWLRQCLSRFSSFKLFYPLPFPYFTLWKDIIMHSPNLRRGDFTSLREGFLHKFEILLLGRLTYFPHLFVYLNIYLCLYGFKGTCFIFWALFQDYLFVQIIPAMAVRGSFI